MNIETWNGTATVKSASRDGFMGDIARGLMDGVYHIADGIVYCRTGDGDKRVAYITFPDSETEHNYMVDFSRPE